MGLAGRLAKPKLNPEETGVVIGLISRYLDGYWADYIDLPKPDPAKREQVLQLHAALKALMEEVFPIDISLSQERRAQQAAAE